MVTTYTLQHPAPDGGPGNSSTVVSPHPIEVAEACRLAAEAVDGIAPSLVLQNTLDYPQPLADSTQGVQAIATKYVGCSRCHLSSRRTFVCNLKGDPNATVACVGDGPTRDDNERGTPFVGPAGRLQDELFREFGIDPFSLAWLNLVGCRPCEYAVWAANRPPTRIEMLACSERTWGLLSAVRPRVVVCLGKEATALFWDKPPPVWTWHRVIPPDAPDDWVMVGHARHPAYLARVIGMPSNYKEYASARTFYSALSGQMASLSKTVAWRFGLRYLNGFTKPEAGR